MTIILIQLIEYWTWAAEDILAVVTPSKIYHFSVNKSTQKQQKIIDRVEKIKNANVVTYALSFDQKWSALSVVSKIKEGRILAPHTQLHLIAQNISQKLPASNCTFGRICLRNQSDYSNILCFDKMGQQYFEIGFVQLSPPQGKNAFKNSIRLVNENGNKQDITQFMVIDEKQKLLYVVSKFGLVSIIQVSSCKQIHSIRIGSQSILSVILRETGNDRGILVLSKNGSLSKLSLEEDKVVKSLPTQSSSKISASSYQAQEKEQGQNLQVKENDFSINKQAQLKIDIGFQGNFYQGFQISRNRKVLINFVEQKILNKIQNFYTEIPQIIKKFKHPNILQFYGSCSKKEGMYLLFQYCSGNTLYDYSKTKIPENTVIQLFKQLIDGMAYLNSINIMLKEILPTRIFVTDKLQLKIASYSLATYIDKVNLDYKGSCTPLYSAPQRVFLIAENERGDVWSAGCILYQMLTGTLYFNNYTLKSKVMLIKAQLKLKDLSYKFNYQNLHPLWQEITKSLFTYENSLRPTFQMVKQRFQQQAIQIQNGKVERKEISSSPKNLIQYEFKLKTMRCPNMFCLLGKTKQQNNKKNHNPALSQIQLK